MWSKQDSQAFQVRTSQQQHSSTRGTVEIKEQVVGTSTHGNSGDATSIVKIAKSWRSLEIRLWKEAEAEARRKQNQTVRAPKSRGPWDLITWLKFGYWFSTMANFDSALDALFKSSVSLYLCPLTHMIYLNV